MQHQPPPPPPPEIITEMCVYNLTAVESTGCSMVSDAHALFTIPHFIENNANVSYVYVSVESANIPVSFYVVHAYNDGITVNGTAYSITHGNYNARTMVTLLNTLLPDVTVSYDATTNKLEFYSAAALSIGVSSAAPVLGLGASAMSSAAATTLYAPNCVCFLPAQRICVRSSLLQTSGTNSYDASCDTLLSLPTAAAAGGVVYFSGTTTRILVEREYLSQLDLRLTDEYNHDLAMNGVPWTVSVRVESVVRRQPPAETFRSIIAENAQRLSAFMEAQYDAFAVEQRPLWYDSKTSGAAMLNDAAPPK